MPEAGRRPSFRSRKVTSTVGSGEVKIDIIQGKQPKLGLSRYTDEGLAPIARRFEKAGIEIANLRQHGASA